MLELVVSHDGRNWLAANEQFSFRAPTLEGIDAALEQRLKEEGLLKNGERIKILMAFNNATLPAWIRQYSQHYFNRMVELSG